MGLTSQFENLILDDIVIEKISDDDKKFLEEFTNLEYISFNSTRIRSLNNLPDAENLIRVHTALNNDIV